MLLWIILAVVAAVVIYAIVVFNSLVRTRQMVNEAWSGIDVQLERRSDLIPNLVDTVKGYAAHERGVLERVTQLRGAAQTLCRRAMSPLAPRPKAPCRPRFVSSSPSPRTTRTSKPAPISCNCSSN